jgi:hypothetical protein
MSETDIISSDNLFSNDDLEKLNQLAVIEPETIIEVRNGQYFVCSAFDPNANDINAIQNTTSEVNKDWKVCPICKVRLQDLGVASSECSQCGAEINKNSEDQEIKKTCTYTGTVTSNYLNCDSKAYVRCKIVKELKQKSYNSAKHKIPQFIIEDAVDQFLTISEHKIHRGSVQRALKAKLIQYKLIESNMIKPSKVITQMFELTDKQLSAADALLREYDAEGIIKIQCLNVDRTESFIRNYINIFKIDGKYGNFIIDLINEADRKKVHLTNNFKPSTKATGAFILFLNSFPDLGIKKSDVIKESGLTSSTVNRYYNLLMDNIHLLIPVYTRWALAPPIKEQKKQISKSALPPTLVTIKLEPLPTDNGIILTAISSA